MTSTSTFKIVDDVTVLESIKEGSPSPLLNQKIDEIAPTTGLTIYTYITHYTLTPYRSE